MDSKSACRINIGGYHHISIAINPVEFYHNGFMKTGMTLKNIHVIAFQLYSNQMLCLVYLAHLEVWSWINNSLFSWGVKKMRLPRRFVVVDKKYTCVSNFLSIYVFHEWRLVTKDSIQNVIITCSGGVRRKEF